MDCRCMEFVAACWCTGKWLRLYQVTRNLTSANLGILLVVIRLGVTGLKKIGSCISYSCLTEEGRRNSVI